MNDDTDKILQAEMSDEETIVALARLCRHRNNCMDADTKLICLQKKLIANQDVMVKNMEHQLKLERQLPGLGRWMTAINNWAKS